MTSTESYRKTAEKEGVLRLQLALPRPRWRKARERVDRSVLRILGDVCQRLPTQATHASGLSAQCASGSSKLFSLVQTTSPDSSYAAPWPCGV